MIVKSTDPIGGETAALRPGGSSFIYESEDSFSDGWALALWFEYYETPPSIENRIVTFEDLDNPSNDLRIYLQNNILHIGDYSFGLVVPQDTYYHLFITSIPGSTDLWYSYNSIGPTRIAPGKTPLNSRIVIGASPDRLFRGSLWDIRVYNKALASRSGIVLYEDAIQNNAENTVPL